MASYRPEEGRRAIDAVTHHASGNFLAALTIYVPHAASTVIMEAFAPRHRLSLPNEIGCNRLQAESDCLEVIEACSRQ